MTFKDWLEAQADGGLIPTSEVKSRYEELGGAGPEVVTTRGASEMLGFSVKFWRMAAENGAISGAWREEGGIWRLPLAECRRHLLKRQNQKKEFQPRGPAKKRSA